MWTWYSVSTEYTTCNCWGIKFILYFCFYHQSLGKERHLPHTCRKSLHEWTESSNERWWEIVCDACRRTLSLVTWFLKKKIRSVKDKPRMNSLVVVVVRWKVWKSINFIELCGQSLHLLIECDKCDYKSVAHWNLQMHQKWKHDEASRNRPWSKWHNY